eukprot:m.53195 g.53195  ORF g.53195 m.53195 type:complete len:163 (-) comp21723_c0_seq1:476-964(-)
MTGVIDRMAVLGDHLHYNPTFESNQQDTELSPDSPSTAYLEVFGYPEKGKTDDHEGIKTSEIVFHTGGARDRSDDFEFSYGRPDSIVDDDWNALNDGKRKLHTTQRQKRRRSQEREQPINLNTEPQSCTCSWRLKLIIGIVLLVLTASVTTVLILKFYLQIF